MKKALKYLSTFSWCILFSANSVFVQQGPEELIIKHNLSFPIAELGNCANYQECRSYCEDPLNQNACASYAKEKGFYEAPAIDTEKETIVNLAKGELGCDSHDSCKNFCEQKENFEKCNNFAQKNNLIGGYSVDPGDKNVLEKAKKVLGCNSYESCKAYCQQKTNADICTQFARKVGIRGGAETKGPGKCTSEATCKAYCSNPINYQECSKFTSLQKTEEFRGPGGCNSEDSCKAYCDKNPKECYGHSSLPYAPSDAINACSKIAGCVWVENSCQCTATLKDPKTVCDQTPGCSWTGASCQCLNTQTSVTGTVCQPPGTGCGSDKYWNYERCSCDSFSSGSSSCQPPSTGCGTDKYWDSYYCSCKSYSSGSSTYTPTPTSTSSTNYCQPPNSGCGTDKYWDSYYCSCKSYSSGSPSSYPTPTPTSSTTNTCQEPSGGCGTNYYWDSNYCSCKPKPTSTTCQPPTSGCGTDKYWDSYYCSCRTSTSTMSLSDQEKKCKETTGCTWTGTTCQCAQGIRDTEFTEKLAKEHDITFPIAELGNCDSCGSCNDYCSNPANKEKCNAYAIKTGLYQEEEKEKNEIFQSAKTELGCDSEESCKLYCQKEDNFDKCKTFAAKQDIIDDPAVLNIESGDTISETKNIELKAPKTAIIEIMLQPLESVTDTLYIGRTHFEGDLTTGDFAWDSTHTPNGEYNLIAAVYEGENVISTIGPIRIEVNNLPLPDEQPVTTKDIVLASQFKPEETVVDNSLTINTVREVKTETNDKGILLQGAAQPNTIITLLIYSNPIVVTVKTDANGLWKYTLQKPLDSGEHTAYLVTGRTDGTKIRSEVSSFFVAPALAASQDENLELESASEFGPLQIFVYITIVIILLAVVGMLIIYRLKARSSSSDNNPPSNI